VSGREKSRGGGLSWALGLQALVCYTSHPLMQRASCSCVPSGREPSIPGGDRGQQFRAETADRAGLRGEGRPTAAKDSRVRGRGKTCWSGDLRDPAALPQVGFARFEAGAAQLPVLLAPRANASHDRRELPGGAVARSQHGKFALRLWPFDRGTDRVLCHYNLFESLHVPLVSTEARALARGWQRQAVHRRTCAGTLNISKFLRARGGGNNPRVAPKNLVCCVCGTRQPQPLDFEPDVVDVPQHRRHGSRGCRLRARCC